MNLGGFAGGLAQGYQSAEKMKMAQQELDDTKQYRERTMKIQEADQAAKEVERKRDTDLRDSLSKLNVDPEFGYGPRKVQVGTEQVTGADGAVTAQPKYEMQQRVPGQDPHFDTQHNIKQIALLSMRYPEKLAEHQKQIEEFTKSQFGRDVSAFVLNKDPDAAARLGKKFNFDPAKATLETDPATHHSILNTGDGRKLDVNALTNLMGGAEATAALKVQEVDRRAVETQNSNLGKVAAETGKLTAEATIGIPAKAAHDIAAGNAVGVQAGAAATTANTTKVMLADDKANRTLNQMIEKATSGHTDKSDFSGKTAWTAPREFIVSRVLGAPEGGRDAAAATAMKDFVAVKAHVRAKIGALPDAAAKAAMKKYGARDKDVLEQKIIEETLAASMTQ